MSNSKIFQAIEFKILFLPLNSLVKPQAGKIQECTTTICGTLFFFSSNIQVNSVN